MRLGQGLDHCNLLPSRWVLAHPLHASAFVANLGSLRAHGAYHPLYEHGAISLAVVVGSLRKNANPRDGHHRRRCSLHYTYDGRIAEAAECVAFATRVKALLEDPKFSLS